MRVAGEPRASNQLPSSSASTASLAQNAKESLHEFILPRVVMRKLYFLLVRLALGATEMIIEGIAEVSYVSNLVGRDRRARFVILFRVAETSLNGAGMLQQHLPWTH